MVSPTAALVWDYLRPRAHDGWVTYTVADLSKATGRCRRSVQYGLRELRAAGNVSLAEQVAPGVYRRKVNVHGHVR